MATQSNPELQEQSSVIKSLPLVSFVSPTNYGSVKVHIYESAKQLKQTIKDMGGNPDPYAIAYCWTYTTDESEEYIADLFFLPNPRIGIVAHECTHLALGVLARSGETSVPVTTDFAEPIEEEFCDIVGGFTDIVLEDLAKFGVTDLASTNFKPPQTHTKSAPKSTNDKEETKE